MRHSTLSLFFFFNDTATTEIYTLSLHDALPISQAARPAQLSHGELAAHRLDGTRCLYSQGGPGLRLEGAVPQASPRQGHRAGVLVLHHRRRAPDLLERDAAFRRAAQDRKSTRLNSSHGYIS